LKDFIQTDIDIIIHQVKERAKKMVIITHRNPDGDAIGASLGLLHVLKRLDHEVKVITPNEIPEFLTWMPGFEHVIIYSGRKEEAADVIKNAEIIFAVDFNDLSRIREFNRQIRDRDVLKVLIDHHPRPDDFADVIISNTQVSSSAELVYHFLQKGKLKHLINKEAAECLFTGIITDTGCFKFNSSNPETYIIISELLQLGIDKDAIYSLVYDNFSEQRMRLFGQCLLNKMKIVHEFNTGYIVISKEETGKFDFQPGDSEGFVNVPLSIRGICFSALFTENGHMIKISFRSKGNFPANEIAAKYFNGGGHLNAAGGESYESLEKTIQKFENVLKEYQKQLSNVS
jgi:bifunctional oligoribonuclease and PAP phosphatase NrnA